LSIQRGDLRPGEKGVQAPDPTDAALRFIGRIETPWATRSDCPHQGDATGPLCRLIVADLWAEALTGIERHSHLQILYWMDQARRDLVLLSPRSRSEPTGTFSLRAPTRPNPIASSIVALVERQGSVVLVRGLDCLDGTPLLDIKPWKGANG
jgi:tRNA-Thr(GGU) m(6)t(6)A37 methyltransferase TsaA